jgi:hypothetical protein
MERNQHQRGRPVPDFLELDIDVEIIFGSARGWLEVSAKCGKMKVGHASIVYDGKDPYQA